MVKTAIAILNWNGKKYLEKFLLPLIKSIKNNDAEIFIIDNCSTDNSITFLKDNFPEISIIQLDKNYGFTGGYNRGLKQIKAEYFLLLNSDIEVTENWLEPLVNYMDSSPDVGVCGPKLLDYQNRNEFEYAGGAGGFIDKFGYPFCRGRVFDVLEKDIGQYDNNIDCFWITGAALMIRAEIFNSLSGFDDSFFAHMEEIDLCWRVQSAGYRVVCIPESTVYHVGGGTLNKLNAKKTFFNFKNNLSLLLKNLPKRKLPYVFFVRLILDQIAALRILMQGNIKHFAAVYKAYFVFLKNFSKIRKQRTSISAAKQINGFYNKSIVFEHFIRRKRRFSELKIIKNQSVK